jgi:DNA-binding transcriptional ArsR family regulator
MSSERFNKQFVLIDFEDLDNPEFLAFVRSPEYSTYLLMRRYLWRSFEPHPLGLHELYQSGLLACALDREKIAEQLGGVSTRTVTTDLASLERRGIVEVRYTGRQNIFILGRWGQDDGVRYEIYFADRLHTSLEENFQAEETGRYLPGRVEENFQAGAQLSSTLNREENRERNRDVDDSKGNFLKLLEARRMIESYVVDYAREFRDEAPLASSVTRATNLYMSSGLSLDEFILAMAAARETTQRRTGAIRKQSGKGEGAIGSKNKMPYWYATLEQLVLPDDELEQRNG